MARTVLILGFPGVQALDMVGLFEVFTDEVGVARVPTSNRSAPKPPAASSRKVTTP